MSARPISAARLVVLVLVLAGCTSSAALVRTGTAQKVGGDITVWVGPSPSLHPHVADADVAAALFSPLVVVDVERGRLPAWGDDAPAALLQEIRSADLRRWDLQVKEGRRWHDGTELTAEDVARGVRAAVDAGVPVASTIIDVRVVDKTTLALALAGPFGQLPTLLADPALTPLPPAADADPDTFEAEPVGSGPYRLAGRDGALLAIEAVPDHPAGPVATSTLAVSLADAPDRPDDVLVGTDGGPAPPPVHDAQVVHRADGRQLAYLGMPLYDLRYAQPDVREALSLAIDREALASVLDGAVVPADRLVARGVARADEVTCEACTFDPERAAALWPDDFEEPLSIWFAADAGHEPVIDFLAESWRRVLGVEEVQLASAPSDALVERLQDAAVTGPFRLTWAADVPSPSRVLQPLFGPRGVANDARYRGPDAAEALDAADLARDASAAREAYAAAEELVLADLPVIPLWFSTVPVVADDDVVVAFDGMGRIDWTALTRE